MFDEYKKEGKTKVHGKENILIVCPSCGSSNKKKFHCSIVLDKKPYIKCFVCGYFKSLITNEEFNKGEYIAPKRKIDNEWVSDYKMYMDTYLSNSARYEQWYKYKQLSPQVVDEYKLGLGQLPYQKHNRLITPLFYNQEFLTFRGRSLNDKVLPKWIFAKGGKAPSEFNLLFSDIAPKNCIILIVENYVDAILFNQLKLTVEGLPLFAIPTLSTNNWFELWTNDLLALTPTMVVVCFDNDYAGNGLSQDMLANELKQRIINKHGYTSEVTVKDIVLYEDYYTIYYNYQGESKIEKMIAPSGIRLNNLLAKIGFSVQLMNWQKISNLGKDLGDLLCQ